MNIIHHINKWKRVKVTNGISLYVLLLEALLCIEDPLKATQVLERWKACKSSKHRTKPFTRTKANRERVLGIEYGTCIITVAGYWAYCLGIRIMPEMRLACFRCMLTLLQSNICTTTILIELDNILRICNLVLVVYDPRIALKKFPTRLKRFGSF